MRLDRDKNSTIKLKDLCPEKKTGRSRPVNSHKTWVKSFLATKAMFEFLTPAVVRSCSSCFCGIWLSQPFTFPILSPWLRMVGAGQNK